MEPGEQNGSLSLSLVYGYAEHDLSQIIHFHHQKVHQLYISPHAFLPVSTSQGAYVLSLSLWPTEGNRTASNGEKHIIPGTFDSFAVSCPFSRFF